MQKKVRHDGDIWRKEKKSKLKKEDKRGKINGEEGTKEEGRDKI